MYVPVYRVTCGTRKPIDLRKYKRGIGYAHIDLIEQILADADTTNAIITKNEPAPDTSPIAQCLPDFDYSECAFAFPCADD
jgi:hypothetical protein